ncbi:ABC transporter substrate-binding protein [Planosporangium mesophilum]|uniref:Sugar ABC transporter substrate-binding protein n=1 Tax=Planosporangium mesophilum TaxID=689768 RepID=A0A8J3TBB3_9ACTN|nr:sugar ABC transporter substrate-binding protein [Planosporangium mesophilum]GII23483.1 sugar ABC transporter substrate-binding protein [Planosporangium mesophilum]
MTLRRLGLVAVVAALLAPTLVACGGGSGSSSDNTLTYWASNQGTSLDHDRQVLQPQLDKFTKQTGIKVKLEVIGWPDLLNRILAAAASGKGPDVLNIGNTWSPSLQATGALLPFDDATLATVGGKSRFLPGSMAATGAPGKPPTAVPLYSLAYGLYYNKKLFAAAGITEPPKTWAELVDVGKKLTRSGQWGLVVEGGNPTENAHHAFTFGQQYGADAFDASGKPRFDSPGMVAGVKRYVGFMANDKIVNPSAAEYAKNESLADFASGKAAMLLWQAADTSLQSHGMSPDDYAVAPVPFEQPTPPGGKKVNSMVAGINLAVFANTKHKDAALSFVKFMTSDEEQLALNKTYRSMPTVESAYSDPAFQTPQVKVFRETLATSAAPLPAVPEEAQFETLVGAVVKDLFADAASGKPITDDAIKSKLTAANQQVHAGG